MHLYIVVDCKTENCEAAHVLMHLGEKGRTPSRVEYPRAVRAQVSQHPG
jgi:hypothetical protein